jgi:hypothetical protein
VPTAYIVIVISSVRVRQMRSHNLPNTMPPIAHPTSRSEVPMPVYLSVAAASAEPIFRPSSVGMQFDET